MGDRGSKSDFLIKSVKEQRVKGNWCGINNSYLRCTLIGFERNYQVRIPSNYLITLKRLYSSLPINLSDNLNP